MRTIEDGDSDRPVLGLAPGEDPKCVSGLGYEAVETPRDHGGFNRWRLGRHLHTDEVMKGGATEDERLIDKCRLRTSALGDHDRCQLGPSKQNQRVQSLRTRIMKPLKKIWW